VFVTNLDGDWPRVFVNPILSTLVGTTKVAREGCLSAPDFEYKRKRHSHVMVSALGLDGNRFALGTDRGYYRTNEKLGRLMAHVIQHEMEHLEGIDVRTGEVRF
jgi:peptide deformylase